MTRQKITTGLETPSSLATGLDPMAKPITSDLPSNQRPTVRFTDEEWPSVIALLKHYDFTFSKLVKRFIGLAAQGYVFVSPEDFELLQQAKAQQATTATTTTIATAKKTRSRKSA